ncbi:TlyA family RNA methyltransferase [Angustibacter luteus]|uniref:TlyA family RNA methyltransferase n=1 Tax=Angustibacter luteus TaxID=658456 RepID=A0ABW1J8T7_9ACTN
MTATRLDVELVRRGLARSRGQAEEMIRDGRVVVDGRPSPKASTKVTADTGIDVRPGEHPDYVGRGALKLDGLLDDLQVAAGLVVGQSGPLAPAVAGRRCLDAGASTGGFTEVLLARGASEVLAVDVGHDQLAARLRTDPRVQDLPGTTVRGLSASTIGGRVDLLVADLSFISLQVVMGDLANLVTDGGDLLLLVKPQFEVGRERLGSGGVVRDHQLRADAVQQVARAGLAAGLLVRAMRASRWPGPSGNVEYFVWLTVQDGTPVESIAEDQLAAAAQQAVEEGPS